MEEYVSTGRFPSHGTEGHIETEVKTQYWWEFLKIYMMVGTFGLMFNIVLKMARLLVRP